MRIHNTLTRQAEEFVPIDPTLVKIYTCGPTVYDNAHIGNLSSYIYADMLRRTLNLAGYRTKHVMNITDVDDKTIRKSQEKYPDLSPNDALHKLTNDIYKVFLSDMEKVGNDVYQVKFIHATDSMHDIQKLIKFLLIAEVAYIADDGIYFNIKKYSESRKYGQLSKVELPSEMKSRINNDEYDKDSVQDFALWKAAKPDEPAWAFEHEGKSMRGRPGWHIECSAMSVKHLGQPFDIHTGGIDLVFPHHENEIAQSTADGQPEKLANYFMHNCHLLVNCEKMAKSKGNFYTLRDVEFNGYSALDFRMLILQSHYQTPSNFSWDNLKSARNRLMKWRAVAELRHQLPKVANNDPQETVIDNLLLEAVKALVECNLNTPEALKYIDEAFDVASGDPSSYSIDSVLKLIEFVDRNLGLALEDTTPDISDDIKEQIQLRSVVRANGDYAKSDEIRDKLLSQGIKLNDIPDGVIWSRI